MKVHVIDVEGLLILGSKKEIIEVMEEIVNIIKVNVEDNITFDEDVCSLTEEYNRVSFAIKYS